MACLASYHRFHSELLDLFQHLRLLDHTLALQHVQQGLQLERFGKCAAAGGNVAVNIPKDRSEPKRTKDTEN